MVRSETSRSASPSRMAGSTSILADEFWRCVEIGANGWRIAENPPVRFRRSAGMQHLPLPVRSGSIESLALFLNLASENDFVLVVAWLLGALRAGGPYPVLAIAGEQGSAKTVLSKLLRAVIDPSVAPVRAQQRPRPGFRQSQRLAALAVG